MQGFILAIKLVIGAQKWHHTFIANVKMHNIINLEKTVEGLEAALPFITKVVASGKQIIICWNKKHLKEIIKQSAEKAGRALCKRTLVRRNSY
jgi:ribosomal protein S2